MDGDDDARTEPAESTVGQSEFADARDFETEVLALQDRAAREKAAQAVIAQTTQDEEVAAEARKKSHIQPLAFTME